MPALVEKIFHFPKLYIAKALFLKKINGLDALSLDKDIENKNIIDIGCGATSFFYDPNKAKKRTGVDTSSEMIEKANALYPTSFHQVASADNLPFDDASFDIAILQFVLHHIPAEKWMPVLSEAKRVSRGEIIILDHVKHDRLLPSLIQQTWWSTTDGGEIYRKENDWKHILAQAKLEPVAYQRLGALFGNICYYRLKFNNHSNA